MGDDHEFVQALVEPKVKVGGTYRSGPVMIEVDDIELLPFSTITDDDLARVPESPTSRTFVDRQARAGPIDDDTLVFRVEFHVVVPTGEDAEQLRSERRSG